MSVPQKVPSISNQYLNIKVQCCKLKEQRMLKKESCLQDSVQK